MKVILSKQYIQDKSSRNNSKAKSSQTKNDVNTQNRSQCSDFKTTELSWMRPRSDLFYSLGRNPSMPLYVGEGKCFCSPSYKH